MKEEHEQILPDQLKKIDAYFENKKNQENSFSQMNTNSANEVERILSGQLILIATVILSANAIFFSSQSFIEQITSIQTLLIIIGISFLIGSIISGIRYYFILIKFHQDWAVIHFERGGVLEEYILNDEDRNLTELTDKLKNIKNSQTTSQKWLMIEIGFLVGACLCYLLLAIGFLLDFTSIL